VGRMADQGHWLSDQVVGVVFGYAVGKEVARRQKQRLEREKKGAVEKKTASRSSPYLGASRNGTELGWQVQF